MGDSTYDVHQPPGYRREAGGVWTDSTGQQVSDKKTLDRLLALALPPAWKDVWAAEDPAARVQARGIDSRGRVQYRYSDAAVAAAAVNKYAHMLHFAEVLPELRKQVATDLNRRPTSPDLGQVTALAVRLLDRALFRVGNRRYTQDNHTYGLTTLERSQVSVKNRQIVFDYIGKEHIRHRRVVADAAAARVMAHLLASGSPAPDAPVFRTRESPPRRVTSATVNTYIHTACGAGVSAKTFRTWGGTVIAAAVRGGASFDAPKTHRDQTLYAYEAAAHVLGNTPAMARSSYVHPRAVEVGTSSGVRQAVTVAAGRAGTDEVTELFADEALQEAVRRALAED